MSMDKIANLQLETTAQYQSLSKLNIQFWNQDRETAILQFQITRNNYPLALSEENVKVFIALESGDSFLVDDKLDFVDQLNGVVSYTIPADFMRVAKEVKRQVYVTTLDEEEVCPSCENGCVSKIFERRSLILFCWDSNDVILLTCLFFPTSPSIVR